MTTVITPPAPTRSPSGRHYRPLEPDDLDAVVAMLRRCSRETLFRRFHGVTDGTFFAHELATTHRQESLGAWVGDDCIGIATIAVDADHDLSVLVEDAWQGRGVGTELVERLVDEARAAGVGDLRVDVLADNRWALRTIARIGTRETTLHMGVYTVRVKVERP